MTRKDIHRPSAIQPDEYVFVAFDYIKLGESGDIMSDCHFLNEQRAIKAAHMAMTGGKYSNHEHGGSCYICGAHAIYTSTFYHPPTNSYIRTGSDCAAKLEMGGYGDFNSFKKNMADYLEARAGKRKAAGMLAEQGSSRAWEIYTADYENLPGEMIGDDKSFKRVFQEEITIRDMVGKLVKYGSISEKAMKYIGTLLGRIDNRPAMAAKREEERAAAADCPTGRMIITATVLGLKEVDGFRGPETKALMVVEDGGYKIYGSRFNNIDKGDKVKFTATLEPSRSDSKFGFYKRPAKGEILWSAGDTAASPEGGVHATN